MIPDNCTFCGLCCTLTVRLSKADIRRIQKTGRKKEDFLELVSDESLLKLKGDKCIFLNIKNSVGCCSIYESRPADCRRFPGKTCKLAGNPLFNIAENRKNIVQLLKNAPTAKTSAERIRKIQETAWKTLR